MPGQHLVPLPRLLHVKHGTDVLVMKKILLFVLRLY